MFLKTAIDSVDGRFFTCLFVIFTYYVVRFVNTRKWRALMHMPVIEAPSGRILDARDLDLLRLMGAYGFIRHSKEPFTLNSGIESNIYVFGREDLTDNPNLLCLVGKKIASVVRHVAQNDTRQPCLIGLPTAGSPLAQAASMVDYASKDSQLICFRTMREVRKEHGAHRTWVNGRPDTERHYYMSVDNIVTDGATKINDAEKLNIDGYPGKTMPHLIFVDRQQGALIKLAEAGLTSIEVIYNLLDITFAFGELGLWPQSAVTAVENEIKAHQTIQV